MLRGFVCFDRPAICTDEDASALIMLTNPALAPGESSRKIDLHGVERKGDRVSMSRKLRYRAEVMAGVGSSAVS